MLIDTYDTERGADKVVKLAKKGLPVRGVRLDSGDLVRRMREPSERSLIRAGSTMFGFLLPVA